MSGGSFNYLYCQEVENLIVNTGYFSTIERMMEDLQELGHEFAAQKTEYFYGKLREINLLGASIEQFYRDFVYPKWNDAIIDSGFAFRDNISWRSYDDYIAHSIDVKNAIEDMKVELSLRGYEEQSKFADEIMGKINVLLSKVESLEKYRQQFMPVWKAVEWYFSLDSGLDEIEKSCQVFQDKYVSY